MAILTDYLRSQWLGRYHHAISVGLIVLFAAIINHYYGFTGECWMPLGAFFVCQTTIGTPLKQSFMMMVLISIALMIAQLITAVSVGPWIAIILFLLVAAWCHAMRPLSGNVRFLLLLAPVIIVIATLVPSANLPWTWRVIDVLIGGVLGVVCLHIFYPINVIQTFNQEVSSILRMQQVAMLTMVEQFENPSAPPSPSYIMPKYPNWVFEVGFSRGLRAGFRFFIVNLEWIDELLCSLAHNLRHAYDESEKLQWVPAFTEVIKHNSELFDVLISYFEREQQPELLDDFLQDMDKLNEEILKLSPATIELVEFSPDALNLAALLRSVKDMRTTLLNLIAALPDKKA